ncbi:MAG: tyrosine-type recombinase/integrase [Firmicutes bacterium]|nr:tyrosine-type recombinase/integrase [Bacillota bacterium]
MATVKKHTAKDGTVTYYIRAYNGYDGNGKQIEHYMKWEPKPGMSEKAINKELEHQKALFEEKIKRNMVFDSNTTFGEYAKKWLENNKVNFAPKTYQRYKGLLVNIDKAIGGIKLVKLQPQHLMSFYNNLREEGVNQRGNYAISESLDDLIKRKGVTKESLAEKAGIGIVTLRTACRGKHISIGSAQAIAKALKMSVKKIFELNYSRKSYSEKTILHYHRLIGVILKQAAMEELIPKNIASKDYIKAPRVMRKEAVFLEDTDVAMVIKLLQKEHIRWRTAVMLLLYSGMRRGELMGIEWKDIDFDNKVIHIRRASQFVAGIGIITKDTKNVSSQRTIGLPEEAFDILMKYKAYCDEIKERLGDYYVKTIEITYPDGKKERVINDRVFAAEDGSLMNPDSISAWMKRFVEKNDLPKFTPHSLRHTNASLMIANGVNVATVSKRLGHATVNTTTRVYSHAIQSADAKAANILSEKINLLNNLD